uniref:Putative nuclear porin n=1 Tax=Nyssomyia neivai TaxID=330878 RepID=A0A1L8DY00_9DIPT
MNNPPGNTGFTFSSPASISFGTGGDAAAKTPLLFSSPASAASTPPTLNFGTTPAVGLGTPTAAPFAGITPGFTPGFTPVATSTVPAIPASTSTATSLTFSIPAATTTGGGFTGFRVPATTTATQPPTPGPAVNLNTATLTTASSQQSTGGQLNLCQLEEYINKWTLELEGQEKVFTNKATEINAWDKILTENAKKIVSLHESVENVTAEQKILEHELEIIAAQHSELEECIKPLESELAKMVQVDGERAQTYMLAENLDTQLKQMSEDLKEVIEHLNEANKEKDPNDPIVQIGKILNAHMSSLQWIESSSSAIASNIQEIQPILEAIKRDSDRSAWIK